MRWGVLLAGNPQLIRQPINLKIERLYTMKTDVRKLYELNENELHDLFYEKAVQAEGNASVKSFINDCNLWSATVSEALAIFE